MDFEKLTDIEQAREKHVKVKKHFMRSQSKENQLGSKMITLTDTPKVGGKKGKPKKTDTIGDIMDDWDDIAKEDLGPQAKTGLQTPRGKKKVKINDEQPADFETGSDKGS